MFVKENQDRKKKSALISGNHSFFYNCILHTVTYSESKLFLFLFSIFEKWIFDTKAENHRNFIANFLQHIKIEQIIFTLLLVTYKKNRCIEKKGMKKKIYKT